MKKPHSDVLSRIVFDLASTIDTPRSLAVWLCFKHSPVELLNLPMTDPADNDTMQFRLDYMITEYLKKYKGHETGLDLRDVALKKWLASEVACKATNDRFRTQLREFSSRASVALFVAQRKIAAILGVCQPGVLFEQGKWATGATFDILKQDAAPDNKMTRLMSVTDRALPYLRKVIENDWHWYYALTGVMPDGEFCVTPHTFYTVRGSRFLTVPKSAKTDRCIAAEPTGNSFLQQGVHGYMRRRLKRFGVDLDDQTRNQRGAESAYDVGLATLDLSAASDSISRELVYHLLPLDWAMLLDDLRSPETRVNNVWIRTEKFVSMGNAFCFELETLIFYALARAVCGEDCTVEVYGDDIIVPAHYSEELIALLELCGFTINVDKSYTEGNFYESCGEHYHRSSNVTPPYQKELLTVPSEVIRAHNRIVRYGLTLPRDHRLRRKILKLSKWVISQHPDHKPPLVPYGVEGDDGFLVDPLRLLKSYDKNRGFKCRVLVYRPVHGTVRSEPALYAYKLRRSSFSNVLNTGHTANVVGGRWVYKTRWVPESDTTLNYS